MEWLGDIFYLRAGWIGVAQIAMVIWCGYHIIRPR